MRKSNPHKCCPQRHPAVLGAGRMAVMLVLAVTVWVGVRTAQSAKTPPKGQRLKGNKTFAIARNPEDMTSGMIIGGDWMVTFKDMPTNWSSENALANQIGVQEIFHPPQWNPRELTPSIIFSFSHKKTGDSSPAKNMANDEKRARQQYPDGKILTAPALVIGAKQKAPVRIYEYPHGWDMVVYSEEGKMLYVTTLHCQNAAQCAPFKSFFTKFVRSLDYTGNVTVIDKRKHH